MGTGSRRMGMRMRSPCFQNLKSPVLNISEKSDTKLLSDIQFVYENPPNARELGKLLPYAQISPTISEALFFWTYPWNVMTHKRESKRNCFVK